MMQEIIYFVLILILIPMSLKSEKLENDPRINYKLNAALNFPKRNSSTIFYAIKNADEDLCNPNPCKNFQICDVSREKARCRCIFPYKGKDCDQSPCVPNNPCKNGGKCLLKGFLSTCDCLKGYQGRKCENASCDSSVCENGGTCIVENNRIKCICISPNSGSYCEECHCENGHCKKEPSGKVICECPPEFGLYSERECRKCECGKKANCTFESTWFGLRKDKICLCPNGEKLKEQQCKGVVLESTIVTSTVTETTITYSPTSDDPTTYSPTMENTTIYLTTTTTEDTTIFSSTTEDSTTEETTTYSTTSNGTGSYSTEDTTVFSTESDRPTSSTDQPTYSTPAICDCGRHALSCFLNSDGKKICLCEDGFSQLNDLCIDCYCGEQSQGCYFDENEEKVCLCKKGYAQNKEACTETCKYDRECLNGGICKLNEEGVGFCECRADYSGDRCEINNVCKHFDDICQRYAAVCTVNAGLPSCECSAEKKDVHGLCENICNPSKCIHGRCEIFGDNFKCRCQEGFEGKNCDTKATNVKRDEILFILLAVCIVFFLTLSIAVICFVLCTRLKKEAVKSDLERLIKEK